jgi:hypothetical protein
MKSKQPQALSNHLSQHPLMRIDQNTIHAQNQ